MILILIQNLSFYNKNYYLKDFLSLNFISEKQKSMTILCHALLTNLSPSKKFFTNNYQNSILPD